MVAVGERSPFERNFVSPDFQSPGPQVARSEWGKCFNFLLAHLGWIFEEVV